MDDKIDQLFIRACKSRNPKDRVESVYRRFYLKNQESESHIASILARLVDQHLDYPVTQIIADMQPDNNWRFGLSDNATYIQRVVAVLISKIRYSEAEKFKDLTIPAMFRRASS